MKLNRNFQRGGGLRKNPFRGGDIGYFLELHKVKYYANEAKF